MDTWVASTFGLLWIMLLWTLIYKYPFKSLLSLLLYLHPELELLDQVAILHLIFFSFIFWGTAILFFHSGYSIFCAHWECTGVPISPHLCQHLFGIFFFLVRVIMVWCGSSLFFVFQSAFIGYLQAWHVFSSMCGFFFDDLIPIYISI